MTRLILFALVVLRNMRLLLNLLLSATCVQAATNVAPSLDWADVSNTVYAAASGDTVQLPAGATTWLGPITLTNNITVRGAGMTSTIITNARVGSDLSAFLIRPGASNQAYRITGLQFQGGFSNRAISWVNYFNRAAWNVRVDHCLFVQCKDAGIGLSGNAYGLVDHCDFIDCHKSVTIMGEYANTWQTPAAATIGTTNALIMEDCRTWYTYEEGDSAVAMDSGLGGRYTCRYSTFTNAFDYAYSVWDAHGNQEAVTNFYELGISRGTVATELYENIGDCYSCARAIRLRGGTCLMFNNAFRVVEDSLIAELEEEDSVCVPCDHFGYLTDPPGYDPITNSYFFANTINGVNALPRPQHNPSDYVFIVVGQDYWTNAPATNVYRPLRYPHPRILTDNDPPVPQAFSLLTADGATTGTLQWNDADIETNYTVRIGTNYFLTAPLAKVATVAKNSTSYAPGLPPGTYYWRVEANGTNGTTHGGTAAYMDVRMFHNVTNVAVQTKGKLKLKGKVVIKIYEP